MRLTYKSLHETRYTIMTRRVTHSTAYLQYGTVLSFIDTTMRLGMREIVFTSLSLGSVQPFLTANNSLFFRSSKCSTLSPLPCYTTDKKISFTSHKEERMNLKGVGRVGSRLINLFLFLDGLYSCRTLRCLPLRDILEEHSQERRRNQILLD